MVFNINNYIKVKLTSEGHAILQNQHAELKASLPNFPEYRPPKVDKEGYSKFQGWVLMRTFGEHMNNGCDVPFELDVIIDQPT